MARRKSKNQSTPTSSLPTTSPPVNNTKTAGISGDIHFTKAPNQAENHSSFLTNPSLGPIPSHPSSIPSKYASTQEATHYPSPESHAPQSINHTMLALVQGLTPDLQFFLEPNHKKQLKSITKIQIYRVLLHFNPQTASQYAHPKSQLYKAFENELLPHLKAFQLPPAPASMQVDETLISKDFNPLGRRTTRKMLYDTIIKKTPGCDIPSSSRLDGLRLLYQAHVDPNLIIPGQTATVRKPRVVSTNKLDDMDMEDLRLALQSHAPRVFVHSTPMSHKVLRNLYIKFVLEEEVPPLLLVRGFHYSIIE